MLSVITMPYQNNSHRSWSGPRFVGPLLILVVMSACASTESVDDGDAFSTTSNDPWQPVNRGIYVFNDGLDRVTLKPVAKGYRKIIPQFVRRGVSNFFSNLHTPLTIANQLLQGKGRSALSDTGRLLLNSSVGVGGLFDPASAAGLEEHREDFGQTLATWGVPDGPFVMLPFLGPRSLRDALATPLNFAAHPLNYYDNTSVRDKLWGLEAINVRTRLLAAETLLEDSQDPYLTLREAYRQNRRYLIYDGDPPDDFDEFLDDFLDEDSPSLDETKTPNTH